MQSLRPQIDESRTHDPESLTQDNISLKTSYEVKHSAHQPDQCQESMYEFEPRSKKIKIRIAVFCGCLVLLVIGSLNIPSEVVYDPIDRVQDLFLGMNRFIMDNTIIRNTLQIICSLFMDSMFLATGINWILRGGSSRLIVSTVSFYLIRAMVQAVWVSPFPKQGTYWWDYPGFPSLVVPYGIGTDFFFSGHIGFVTICALEWKTNGNKLMTILLTIGGVYTGLILMLYRVHYSIDLFTGVTFAHYVYILADKNKEELDRYFIRLYYFLGTVGPKAYGKYKSKPQEVEQQLYNNMNNR